MATFYSILVIAYILVLFFDIRISIAANKLYRVMYAIHDYHVKCIFNHETPLVEYNDMQSFDSIILKFWQIGYKNVLPKEKFEIIKPYLTKKKK